MIWNNRAFLAASLSATSEASGYPVTCLQDPFRSRRWRSSSAVGQSLAIDFGSPQNLNTLALVDHNLTFGGYIRVMASDTPGGSDLWDETYDAWTPISGAGEGYYGEGGYGRIILETDRKWAVPNPIRIIYFEDENGNQSTVQARHITIEFTDPNPDGHIEVGYLFPAMFMDFGLNFSNIRHGSIDESEYDRSLSGQQWITRDVPVRRTLGLTFNALLYGDKYWGLKFAAEKLGIKTNFVMDCFPGLERPSQNFHSILYGHFIDLPEIEQNYDMGWTGGNQVSATEITFEEEVA